MSLVSVFLMSTTRELDVIFFNMALLSTHLQAQWFKSCTAVPKLGNSAPHTSSPASQPTASSPAAGEGTDVTASFSWKPVFEPQLRSSICPPHPQGIQEKQTQPKENSSTLTPHVIGKWKVFRFLSNETGWLTASKLNSQADRSWRRPGKGGSKAIWRKALGTDLKKRGDTHWNSFAQAGVSCRKPQGGWCSRNTSSPEKFKRPVTLDFKCLFGEF